jgi:hypothetical protein
MWNFQGLGRFCEGSANRIAREVQTETVKREQSQRDLLKATIFDRPPSSHVASLTSMVAYVSEALAKFSLLV